MNTDRIEVLYAVVHECQRKLLAVVTPNEVLAHADGVEERGKELLQLAKDIRDDLTEWTLTQDEIMLSLLAARVELKILRTEWAKDCIGDSHRRVIEDEIRVGGLPDGEDSDSVVETLSRRVLVRILKRER